jgi:hypothetical protein
VFCPHCGNEIVEGQAFCGHCGSKLAEAGPAQSVGGRSKTSWEDRAASGFVNGLFKTAREVLFRPTEFFRRMPVTGGLTDPLLYALITGMIGLLFLSLWDILLHDSMREFMTHEMKAAAGRTMWDGVHSTLGYSVSPFLFLSVPFCGVLITVIWAMMLAIIGLKEAHQTTGGKAAFAVLFPLLFFCGLIMVLAALFMGAVMASFGPLMHMYK